MVRASAHNTKQAQPGNQENAVTIFESCRTQNKNVERTYIRTYVFDTKCSLVARSSFLGLEREKEWEWGKENS